MTSTIDRTFTGALDIEDQAVSATIRFVGGEVTLLVAGDAVGTWGRHEIEFVPEGSSYELRAEGDSIRFDPDDARAFESFLTGTETPSSPETPSEQDRTEGVAGIGFTPPPIPAQVEHGLDEDTDPDVASGQFDQASLFSEDIEDQGLFSDLSPSFATEEDDPEPALSWDSTPDEMYAAGLDGSSNGSPAPAFRSALVRDHDTAGPERETDPEPNAENAEEEPAAYEAPTAPEPNAESAEEEPVAYEAPTAPEPNPDDAEQEPVAYEAPTAPEPNAEVSEEEPVAYEAPAAPEPADPPARTVTVEDEPEVPPIPGGMGEPETDLPSGLDPTQTEQAPHVVAQTGVEAAAEDAEEADPPRTGLAARFEGRGAGIVGFAHSVVDAFRDRPTDKDSDDEPSFDDDEGDITPEPIDDRENLRQWGLVVAGGLVLLVLIAIVTWGLASMLGGDDPLEAAEETTPTTSATTAATVAPTTSTTPPPPTTVSPENEAAAAGFVETWNGLATQYAYHLSINADSLPISVAPAPTVHLTYDESGVLNLKMVPKGTGSDRDLLLAMGLAVAWGDPGLTPEGRKEVLGAMGVNVEDPQLEEMGGSVSRNGVSYEATVSDGLIEFRVAPQA